MTPNKPFERTPPRSGAAHRRVGTHLNLVDISHAASKDDLLYALARMDISVPLRTDGRKTDHVETWVICRLVSSLAHSDKLEYPVSISKRERPDFEFRYGGRNAGIEVTEAVSKQFAAYSALAEREFPDALMEPSHFRWGAPKLTAEEMRALLRQSRPTGPGWAGDSAEHEWALYIESVITAKLTKLSKSGFEQFPQNWLAIYDNLPPGHIALNKAVSFLEASITSSWSNIPAFDVIYVEHGATIVRVDQTGSTAIALHNLW